MVGGEGPSVDISWWLTTLTVLLWVLGVPLFHSLVRLLMCVATVGAALDFAVAKDVSLASWRCCHPRGRCCLGKRTWELPPMGLSNVASCL